MSTKSKATWRATCYLHSPGHEPVAALHTCQLPSPHAAGRAGGCASGGLHVFWAATCGAGGGCRGASEAKTATQEKDGVVGTGYALVPVKDGSHALFETEIVDRIRI